jgi:diguanylate cyclase (GGDEF)-like protein
MIDIDDFKHFNDTYGHTIGDEVLIIIAEKIKNLFRGSDIVGRVGGDEFVVIMKNVTDLSIVRARCAQIIEKFNETKFSEEESSGINCSVGVAIYPQHGSNYSELFAVADRAMYRAKSAGKNRYYIEEINDTLLR